MGAATSSFSPDTIIILAAVVITTLLYLGTMQYRLLYRVSSSRLLKKRFPHYPIESHTKKKGKCLRREIFAELPALMRCDDIDVTHQPAVNHRLRVFSETASLYAHLRAKHATSDECPRRTEAPADSSDKQLLLARLLSCGAVTPENFLQHLSCLDPDFASLHAIYTKACYKMMPIGPDVVEVCRKLIQRVRANY